MTTNNTNTVCATCTTKPASPKNITDVPIIPQRRVTYVFHTIADNVTIPYAIAVNGAVIVGFESRPKSIKGAGGRLSLTVDQGSIVELYLNSDANPDYRKNPVYKITVGERDIQIDITEKMGKHADADTPTLVPAPTKDKNGKALPDATLDKYTAPLTGDIWMKVSHKYSSAEAEALIPVDTSAEVKAAVKKIYEGLSAGTLTIAIPATKGEPASSIVATFVDSDNPRQNITKYSLLSDGLTRVHPAGYAALLSAARDNKVTSLRVTSCWRPMMGSIAHRAGLGLDVAVLNGITLNRQELRQYAKKGTGNHNDNDNVTDAEVKAFKDYEDALVAQKKAQANATTATHKASLLKASLGKIPKTDTAKIELRKKEITEAEKSEKEAKKAAEESTEESSKKKTAWDTERNAHEPTIVHGYRISLIKCACIGQLLDPWMMDIDGQGGNSAASNAQVTDNERLHAHHLHITVRESKIR